MQRIEDGCCFFSDRLVPAIAAMSLAVNQRVLVRGIYPGTVRFIGPVEYAKGEFVGVELDEPKGKNDGEVKGRRYFSCAKNHGLIARAYDVEPQEAEALPPASGSAGTAGDSSDDDDDAPTLPKPAGFPSADKQVGTNTHGHAHTHSHAHSHGGVACHGHSHGHVQTQGPVKKMSADEIRAMGNDYFSNKEYKTALGFYNRSVILSDDSNRHLSLGNRAITKIFLKDYVGSIKDCDAALALRPDYVKCYTRKGMALRHLNRLEEAFAALEEGMKFAPHDAGIQKEMSRVIKQMQKQMNAMGMGGAGAGAMKGMDPGMGMDMGMGPMDGGGGMGGGMGAMGMMGGASQKKPVRVNKSLIGSLQEAAKRNDIQAVKSQLDSGADVNEKDGHDMVALEWASKLGHIELVKLLLEHKAQVDPVDEEAGSSVLCAAAGGHLDVLKILLDANGSIEIQDSILGHSALHRACDSGREQVVDFLLDRRPQLLSQVDSRGYTPLAVAASKGHSPIVEKLVALKADIAQVSNNGSGPLALAVKASHQSIVRFLMEQAVSQEKASAIVDARVVYNAVAFADDDVLAVVEPLANQAPPDCKGRSPLHIAAEERNENAAEYILQQPWGSGAIDARDTAGETAVITATRRATFSVLKLLVAANADVNVAELSKGRTALHIAGFESMDPIYHYLIQHGADTSIQDAKGQLPELKEKKNCVVM